MKTLVTHINPHLDDITAIWLFKKFHPDFKEAKVEFISAAKGNIAADEDENRVYIGVGRGRFDEHKGDLEDAATSLVWKYLKDKGYTPSDEVDSKALEELVEWVRLDDLGRLKDLPYKDFSVASFIRVYSSDRPEKSQKNLELGMDILDRILEVLKDKYRGERDWEKRREFETSFGKGVAVESEFVNRAFCDNQEGDVFLIRDPEHNSIQFYTPREGIDLEPIYKRVKELDPEAGWFLHQSHKMVICGSGSAPDSKPTKLSLEELMEIVSSI